MALPSLSRALRKSQAFVLVTSIVSSCTMALVGFSVFGLVLGLAAWIAAPLLLRSHLEALRRAAGLGNDPSLVPLTALSLVLAFVGVPLMLVRTARDVGEAVGDAELLPRVRTLSWAYAVLAFAAVPLSLVIPLVGAVAGPIVQLSCLGLATQVLIQGVLDASNEPVPTASSSTGHAAPVGIRTH